MNKPELKKYLNKKTAAVIIALSILAIFASEMWPSGKKASSDTASQAPETDFVENTEKRLKALVESIEGTGECEVMVTVNASKENQYATEQKTGGTYTDDKNSNGEKTQSQGTAEEKIIITTDKDGNQTPLVIKEIEPTVKGVVIVCKGGDNPVVKARVCEAVSTLLGISISNVCVLKMN